MSGPLSGYRRADGRIGVRNHLVVVPSVVCAGLVCREIAGTTAIALEHQHGCGEVGDDVALTAKLLAGVAAGPNVGAALIVGLGCETVQAGDVAARVAAAGRPVQLLSIQAAGGSAAAIDAGRALAHAALAELGTATRTAVAASEVLVGIDDPDAALTGHLRRALTRLGLRSAVPSAGRGPTRHAELAAAGAAVIVNVTGPQQPPTAFATCPTITVSGDGDLHRAIAADFDVIGCGAYDSDADAVADLALAVVTGRPTAAERRGSRQFIVRRLVRTM